MNKFWKTKLYKLKSVFSEENINYFLELVLIACLSGFATVSILGVPGFFVPDKDRIVMILTILGLSIAYSSFFISNLDKISKGKDSEAILKLSKILIVSPVFPIFSILLAQSKIDFSWFNIYLGWGISILTLISVFIFFYCFIKLLSILLKSAFKKK
jgi:hypothetical protein